MGALIEELDFASASASEDDRRGLYDVVTAWAVENVPDEDPPPFEDRAARWTSPDELGFEPPRFAVAREAGKIVGFVQVKISAAEANAHLAMVTVLVLPRHRRRGIGTALLREVPAMVSGRTVIESWSVFQGSPGEHFAAARGFRVITSMTRQRLVLGEPPETRAVPDGYELVTWRGAAPEEFVETYVDGLNAMADAPFGETALASGHSTVESVRREEETADNRVLLLLHEGEVAAVTVVQLNPVVPSIAEQLETVVLPAHRGKGLGRLVKARMLHDLTGVEQIFTRTSSGNEHMLRVNHSLGYEDIYVYLAVQAKTADLQA
ncbi:GNAT family N-acetyltransferase [Lentzea sp. HUAS TT2]|uniref:GNAT family N-acetyltransferase n=1 Tax=Lentzea sp. HUAS TT2 TaxID=3447454 RepID=UPI003F720AB6